MVRPTKTDADKRTTILRMRLTPREYDSLKHEANRVGETVSDMARRRLLRDHPQLPLVQKPAKGTRNLSSPPDFARDPAAELSVETFQELRRIGVNLNQIARRMNASSHVDNAGLAVVNERLGQIFRMMEPRLPASGEDAP